MENPDPGGQITTKEWKRWLQDMLIGVEAELDSTAPPSARAALHGFHHRLKETHAKEEFKSFEHDVDAFLESEEYLKAASGRYIAQKMVPALDKATKLVTKAKALLAKYKKDE